MNRFIKISIIAVVSALFGACSGASNGGGNTNAPPESGNLSKPAPPANSNAEMIPYPGTGNTSGAAPGGGDVTVVKVDPKQLKPTNPAVPASDNSEVLTVMNEKGAVETRIFKSHPLLAKVEKTTYGRDVEVKFYLKNGKVIRVAPEKIENLTTVSAQQLLQAAGIAQQPLPPAPQAGTGAATGTKTEEVKDDRANQPTPKQ